MDNTTPVPQQPIPQADANIVPPQMIVPPPKKSKKMLFIILFILVLLFIITGLGYYFVKSGKQLKVFTPSPTPIPTIKVVSPTVVVSPTSANPIIELTLTKGKEVAVPNSILTILYQGKSAPNPKCVDCATTTDIILKQQKQEQELSYVCGGIAGTCTDKLTGFGYDVMLGSTSETTVQVKIQKQ